MSGRATNTVRLWLWCVALFVATLWLHTRFNDFPYYYHTDEPGKVEQILGMRSLNFHHPMLLLDAAQLALGDARAEQSAVEAGRLVSAIFTAAAVVMLSLLGYVWRGWVVAIGTGLALAMHHQLFELSHYFKEDTALLFGFAVTFLAMHLFYRRPGIASAALLGLGCALAISGKYAGAIVLLPVATVLLRSPASGRSTHFWAAFLAMLVALVAVNWQLLWHWNAAMVSFRRETELVVSGQGMTQSVPHSRYWSIFLSNTTPVIWILLLVALWGAWRRRQELNAAEWWTLAFPFFFAVVLSFSPKENDRYFLPATALFTLLAATGVKEIYLALPGRLRRWDRAAEALAVLLLVAGQWVSWTDDRGGLWRYWTAFQKDDTGELTEFLRGNLPRDAVIAKDEKVRLPTTKRNSPKSPPLPFKIAREKEDFAADVSPEGTIDGLLAMGVSHVVITDSTFRKFERADLKSKEKERANDDRRRTFYSMLRRDFPPLRTWSRGTVIYLHPGLEVYQIRP